MNQKRDHEVPVENCSQPGRFDSVLLIPFCIGRLGLANGWIYFFTNLAFFIISRSIAIRVESRYYPRTRHCLIKTGYQGLG